MSNSDPDKVLQDNLNEKQLIPVIK